MSSTVRICLNVISWYKKDQKSLWSQGPVTICCAFRLNQYILLHSAIRGEKNSLIFLERWMKEQEMEAPVGNVRGHTMINRCLSW